MGRGIAVLGCYKAQDQNKLGYLAMLSRFALTVAVSVLSAVAACAEQAASVTNAWARATPGGVTIGAAYATLTSPDGDTLISVSTPVAGRAEIHTHAEVDGVMTMRKVEKIAIAAGDEHALKPGGDHIMLFELKAPLKQGDRISLTFKFAMAGDVTVNAQVAAIGAKSATDSTATGEVNEHEGHSTDGAGSDHGAH